MTKQMVKFKVNQFIRHIGNFLKFKVELSNLVAGLSEGSQHQSCLEREEGVIYSKMLVLLSHILLKVVNKRDKLLHIIIILNKNN